MLGPDFTCHAGTFSEFASAWNGCRGWNCRWRDNLTIPHVPSSDGNDDAASSEPTTSSHAMHSLSDGQADNRFDGEAMSVPDGDLETVDDMPPQADNNSDVEPKNVDDTATCTHTSSEYIPTAT